MNELLDTGPNPGFSDCFSLLQTVQLSQNIKIDRTKTHIFSTSLQNPLTRKIWSQGGL